MLSVEDIARTCHQVNKAFCESIGDKTQTDWSEAPDWQKVSAKNGVAFHLERGATPEESHEKWMSDKAADGWVYGDVKDVEKKTHPCMIPYDELPLEQRAKDYLFKAVVESLKVNL